MQRKFRRSSSPSPWPRPGPPTSATNRPSPARHAAAQRDLSSLAGLGDHRQPPSWVCPTLERQPRTAATTTESGCRCNAGNTSGAW